MLYLLYYLLYLLYRKLTSRASASAQGRGLKRVYKSYGVADLFRQHGSYVPLENGVADAHVAWQAQQLASVFVLLYQSSSKYFCTSQHLPGKLSVRATLRPLMLR